MRKLFYGISVVAMALGMVACDDSVSSANNEDADKESSSSVISEDASSSSVKPGYSSSVELASSSSAKLVSSSSVKPGSSSSKKDDPKSSSSVVSSSSSAVKVESSSSSRGLFDMTKDEFLNPKISYGEMTDTRDNKTYKTVKIGDQVWMAENLNYADSTKMPSLKGNSWCYDNKTENCDVAGRLYTWAAAIDSVALANDADNPQTCGYGENCTLPTTTPASGLLASTIAATPTTWICSTPTGFPACPSTISTTVTQFVVSKTSTKLLPKIGCLIHFIQFACCIE